MKCKYCNKEFKSKRKDAKYCSIRCRVSVTREGLSVTEKQLSVTEPALSVTPVTHQDLSVTDLVALRHAICAGQQVSISPAMTQAVAEIVKVATDKEYGVDPKPQPVKSSIFNALWLAYDCRSPICIRGGV